MAEFDTKSNSSWLLADTELTKQMAIRLMVLFGDQAGQRADFFANLHADAGDMEKAELWGAVAKMISVNEKRLAEDAEPVIH